jgi:uncharacterized repeat protein (TIGR04138 family)
MVEQPSRTLQDLIRHVGQYPEEAFLFIREGLSYAADRIHGPETPAHRHLQQYLATYDLDWPDLAARYHAGQLPESVANAVRAAGGCDKLNRHVSGRELCWALRDLALQRWGLMARAVFDTWNVRRTGDFGRIVFAFIDFDMMRKQPDDRLEDFENVFDFDDVLNGALPEPTDSDDRSDLDLTDEDLDE